MLIVGELINTSRKAINEAVEKRDAAYIQQIAKEQVEAGADYVDVNCGTQVFDEVEVSGMAGQHDPGSGRSAALRRQPQPQSDRSRPETLQIRAADDQLHYR